MAASWCAWAVLCKRVRGAHIDERTEAGKTAGVPSCGARGRQVMTNMRPKTYFLRPDVALPMGIALLRELWAQRVSKRPDAYQASAGAA